ncbi:MAG: hypothetical protein OXG94_10800 [Bacteroidetes bacterium]|nr:hypothetical protein [Bacteroidota bacterium]
MRQKLTNDNVLEGIVPITDPDDAMLFAAVKTELLQEIFLDFDPVGPEREYYNVFIANQPGMRWNQPQRHEIPPEVFAERPTMSLVIPEYAMSPRLSDGGLALVFTPAPELCQIDIKIPQLQYAAGLRYLHSGDFVKPMVMLRNGLTELWGKRIGHEKVPTGRGEKMAGMQWGGAFTHEETFADLDARVVVNFHPEVAQVHVYRPSASVEPHRCALEEYTSFQRGNLKDFVQAKTKGPEKTERLVSDRPALPGPHGQRRQPQEQFRGGLER